MPFVVGESTLLRKLRNGDITQEEYEHISRLASFERYRESSAPPRREHGCALSHLIEADEAEATTTEGDAAAEGEATTAAAEVGAVVGVASALGRAPALAQRVAAVPSLSASAAEKAADAADAPPARALLRLSAEEKVVAFYAAQDPSKNVPLLLAKYEGRVDKLLARIAKRYGVEALEASYDALLESGGSVRDLD